MLRNIRLCEVLCTRPFDHGNDLYVLSEKVFSVAKTHFAMYEALNVQTE